MNKINLVHITLIVHITLHITLIVHITLHITLIGITNYKTSPENMSKQLKIKWILWNAWQLQSRSHWSRWQDYIDQYQDCNVKITLINIRIAMLRLHWSMINMKLVNTHNDFPLLISAAPGQHVASADRPACRWHALIVASRRISDELQRL